jgi:hypothetical protein
MQPMNYMMDVKSPFENSLSGIQAGVNMAGLMDQSAARQQELQQKQFALQQQKAMQADLTALANIKNPTAQDFAAITTKYPAMAEHFKNTWSMLNTDQQQNRLSQAGQVYAALQSGSPDIAKSLLQKQIDAAKNSGLDRDAQSAETMLKLIDLNPGMALNSAGLMLSSVLGPEKFATTYDTLAKLPSSIAGTQATTAGTIAQTGLTQAQTDLTKTQNQKAGLEVTNTPQRLALENSFTAAQIRNLDSTISERTGRLNLDRDKLQSDVEMKLYELGQKKDPSLNFGDDTRKLINTAATDAVAADQSAATMMTLASKIESTPPRSGIVAKGTEIYKQIVGTQDAVTQLRQEYIRLRNTEAVRMLPPGNASDKDVAVMMQGFPSDTADSSTMVAFLRGMAKVQQHAAVVATAKSEWVNAVGHLGKPRTDIEIDGIMVPKGTSFVDFTKGYVTKKTNRRVTEQSQDNLSTRSYMRWAAPQSDTGQLGTGTFDVPAR